MKSITEIVMLVLLIIVVVTMLYAIFVLFPKKLKLVKKYGGHLTSADYVDLAKRGHQDVKEVVVKTKYALAILIVCGAALVVLKNHF